MRCCHSINDTWTPKIGNWWVSNKGIITLSIFGFVFFLCCLFVCFLFLNIFWQDDHFGFTVCYRNGSCKAKGDLKPCLHKSISDKGGNCPSQIEMGSNSSTCNDIATPAGFPTSMSFSSDDHPSSYQPRTTGEHWWTSRKLCFHLLQAVL